MSEEYSFYRKCSQRGSTDAQTKTNMATDTVKPDPLVKKSICVISRSGKRLLDLLRRRHSVIQTLLKKNGQIFNLIID